MLEEYEADNVTVTDTVEWTQQAAECTMSLYHRQCFKARLDPEFFSLSFNFTSQSPVYTRLPYQAYGN